MKKTYSTLSDLKSSFNRQCKSMAKEIANAVKVKYEEKIQEDVYDSYDPVMYVRRHENGGLAGSVIVEQTSPYEYEIIAKATPNGNDRSNLGGTDNLAVWVALGLITNPYNDNDYVWMHPRPFHKHAYSEAVQEEIAKHIIEKKYVLK